MNAIKKLINNKVKENQKAEKAAMIERDRTMERINSFLDRKDIIDLDNEKIDAIRMLAFYLESSEMKASNLAKFLKK
jgi:hypothetical protein